MSVTGEEAIQPSSDSFWEIGKYKRTVKRAEDGFRLSEDLIAMVQERIAIEKKYAKSLKVWSQKWAQHVEKGPDYGTTEAATKATFEEADRVCEVHEKVSQRLQDNVVAEIKGWQKENYHKPALQIAFKEVKEFEDSFKKAQKPWVKLLTKVQKAKERYHKSCKNEKTASIAEANAKADTSKAPDEVKKSEERSELCRREVESSKDSYLKSLDELNKYNSKYMDDMHMVFDRCNEFEQTRLDFVKEMLFKTHECLNIAYDDTLPTIFSAFRASIENADSAKDLKFWSSTYGAAMAMNWPAFEEYTPELANITKKTAKSGAILSGNDDGVMLTGILHQKDGLTTENSANQPQMKKETTGHFLGRLRGCLNRDSAYPSSQRASANNTPLHKKGGDNVTAPVRNSADEGAETFSANPFEDDCSEGSGGANPFDDDEEDEWDVSRDNGILVDNGEPGVAVRALYDYEGQEDDELTFQAGDAFEKLEDEDEQGWCKGRMNGRVGLYPANYVELV